MKMVARHVQRFLIGAIRLYQWTLSPFLGPCCRFHPSCSVYAREAIECHGAVRGLGLSARRLLRCHPFHPGGHDPVPPRRGAGSRTARDTQRTVQP